MPNWPLESIRTGTALLLPVVTPRTPATKNEVCVPGVPIRMVPLSLAEPWLPMWILLLLLPETFCAALYPDGDVVASRGVAGSAGSRWPCCCSRWCCLQRVEAAGRVVAPGGVGTRIAPEPLAVLSLPVVLLKAPVTAGRVVVPGGVETKRRVTAGRVAPPVVFRSSASTPLAVLLLPVVLVASASIPLAVLLLPVVLLCSAFDTAGRVVDPGGVARQRSRPDGGIAVQVGRRGKVTVHVDDHIRGCGTGVKHADPAGGCSRRNNGRVGHDHALRIVQGRDERLWRAGRPERDIVDRASRRGDHCEVNE